MEMKTLYYLLLFSATSSLQAQSIQPILGKVDQFAFARRTWQVGLHNGYSPGSDYQNRISVQIHGGRFIADKLLIGLGVAYNTEWDPDVSIRQSTVSLGPLVRYQFTRSWVSPFIEATYQLGQSSVKFGSVSRQQFGARHSGAVTPGLSVRVTPHLRVDVQYRMQYDVSSAGQSYFTQRYIKRIYQPQIGIVYLLRRR
jgi:hypothetical protein